MKPLVGNQTITNFGPCGLELLDWQICENLGNESEKLVAPGVKILIIYLA